MTVNIYFVRHGETDMNRLNIIARQDDDSHGLNDIGQQQAAALVRYVSEKKMKCDAILSSTMKRALETAEHLKKHFGVVIEPDDRLREIYFGDFEGMKIDDIQNMIFDVPLTFSTPDGDSLVIGKGSDLRDCYASHDSKYDMICYPGGETKEKARARVMECVSSYLMKNHKNVNDLWIVCHGVVMRSIVAKFVPVAERLPSAAMKNTTMLHYTWSQEMPDALVWQGIGYSPA